MRTLDAIRLVWPSLRDKVYISDLVWLLLIKDNNPKLYRWLEKYFRLNALRVYGLRSVSDAEKEEFLNELKKIVPEEMIPRKNDIGIDFSEKINSKANFGESLFKDSGVDADCEARNEKRLKSPDHYQLYFALSELSYAPEKEDFDLFWKVAGEGVCALVKVLNEWAKIESVPGAKKLQIFLTALVNYYDKSAYEKIKFANILLALHSCLTMQSNRLREEGKSDKDISHITLIVDIKQTIKELIKLMPSPDLVEFFLTESDDSAFVTRLEQFLEYGADWHLYDDDSRKINTRIKGIIDSPQDTQLKERSVRCVEQLNQAIVLTLEPVAI